MPRIAELKVALISQRVEVGAVTFDVVRRVSLAEALAYAPGMTDVCEGPRDPIAPGDEVVVALSADLTERRPAFFHADCWGAGWPGWQEVWRGQRRTWLSE